VRRYLRPRPQPDPRVVERLEQFPAFRGKRTRDIPELAGFRIHYREGFYRQANLFFGLTIFGVILAGAQEGFGHWISVFGVFNSFPMMFFCEFKARAMDRQLNRRAAEQLARDMVGRRD
jgi:hypothetical protein